MHDLTKTFELVRRVQQGDRQAMDALFARYYERVRKSVRPRLGPKLRGQLESGDILQQAFARAFQNFDRFEMRHEGSFLYWIAEIAAGQIHDAADHFGADKRTPPGQLMSLQGAAGQGSGELGDLVAGGDTGPDGRSIANERARAIEECMDALPEDYRRVLILRDHDGLEWREIMTAMGKHSESAPRELHRRALLELARALQRRGIGPG